MKLFGFTIFEKRKPRGKLCCSNCTRPIHKHDRYKIKAVEHVDCKDTKLVGQQSFEDELIRQAGTTPGNVY